MGEEACDRGSQWPEVRRWATVRRDVRIPAPMPRKWRNRWRSIRASHDPAMPPISKKSSKLETMGSQGVDMDAWGLLFTIHLQPVSQHQLKPGSKGPRAGTRVRCSCSDAQQAVEVLRGVLQGWLQRVLPAPKCGCSRVHRADPGLVRGCGLSTRTQTGPFLPPPLCIHG